VQKIDGVQKKICELAHASLLRVLIQTNDIKFIINSVVVEKYTLLTQRRTIHILLAGSSGPVLSLKTAERNHTIISPMEHYKSQIKSISRFGRKCRKSYPWR
jgi:hypothetical protein